MNELAVELLENIISDLKQFRYAVECSESEYEHYGNPGFVFLDGEIDGVY